MNLYACMRCGSVYAGLRAQRTCGAVRELDLGVKQSRCGGQLERIRLNTDRDEAYTITQIVTSRPENPTNG